MSHGVSAADEYRHAGTYVDRILKGERLADLPVQLSTKFEFTINLKTAKPSCFTVPPTVLATADARQELAGDPDKVSKLDAALKALDSVEAASAAPEPSAAGTATSNAPAIHQGGTIQNMVERLAQRLKDSGSDPEGWLILVRSYASLGERDKATAAVADARRALAANPAGLEQFNAALAKINIGG